MIMRILYDYEHAKTGFSYPRGVWGIHLGEHIAYLGGNLEQRLRRTVPRTVTIMISASFRFYLLDTSRSTYSILEVTDCTACRITLFAPLFYVARSF